MTKNEIKAALDLAGIGYKAKINLTDLVKLYNAHCVGECEPLLNEDGTFAVTEEMQAESDEATALVEAGAAKEQGDDVDPVDALIDENRANGFVVPEGMTIADCNCPHCGIQLDNGVLNADDESLTQIEGSAFAQGSGRSYHQTGEMTREWECMACGGQFGPELAPYVAPADGHTGTGLKIEKDRPEQNGIKRPSIGGKCRAIWDALDAYRAETGELPTSKTVKELAADEGWNPNNASIEFYQWRKFHGIGKAA